MIRFGKAPALAEATTYAWAPQPAGCATLASQRRAAVTGFWQVPDADIGRPATLLLGCKRRTTRFTLATVLGLIVKWCSF
jgi:hypothetical protein